PHGHQDKQSWETDPLPTVRAGSSTTVRAGSSPTVLAGSLPTVMAGRVPATRPRSVGSPRTWRDRRCVGGRDTPGHDVEPAMTERKHTAQAGASPDAHGTSPTMAVPPHCPHCLVHGSRVGAPEPRHQRTPVSRGPLKATSPRVAGS